MTKDVFDFEIKLGITTKKTDSQRGVIWCSKERRHNCTLKLKPGLKECTTQNSTHEEHLEAGNFGFRK